MSDIRVEHVTYAYPGATKPVLNQVNLTVRRGEFVLIAGPSGCGKSTLALALAGLIPARVPGNLQGRVYFGEKCISSMDIHETSQHIGMVFQNPDNQLIHLDVEAEVAFGPENLGLPRDVICNRVRESLGHTQMEASAESPIFALSGGQKQRVAISATLAMQPEVLVLDEPTSDLDPVGTQEVLQVLRKLNRERQMTVILIEHKIDEVIPWVDRVVLMDEGRILLDDTPQSAFNNENMWDQLGVSIPEMVRLSHQLPDAFGNQTALTVEEGVQALTGTAYHKTLLSRRVGRGFGQQKASSETLLQWKDVHLSFGDKCVLREANLHVNAGEWVALAGPNGSGKTSLASLAMGFQGPTSGAVRFRDKPVTPGKISRQAAEIGYLFQAADNMLFAGNVRDELTFGKKHRTGKRSRIGMVRGQDLQDMTVEDLARMLDLASHLEKNPFHLSHGQRKRLAIGALLAANPKLMILDEPTTGQDEGHARAFLEFLQTLRRQLDMTYFMITHDMRAAAQYASRLVVLNDGNIVLNGPPAHVFAKSQMLSEASIVPPPIAKLHGMLCNDQAESVSLYITDFIKLLRKEEVMV